MLLNKLVYQWLTRNLSIKYLCIYAGTKFTIMILSFNNLDSLQVFLNFIIQLIYKGIDLIEFKTIKTFYFRPHFSLHKSMDNILDLSMDW